MFDKAELLSHHYLPYFGKIPNKLVLMCRPLVMAIVKGQVLVALTVMVRVAIGFTVLATTSPKAIFVVDTLSTATLVSDTPMVVISVLSAANEDKERAAAKKTAVARIECSVCIL